MCYIVHMRTISIRELHLGTGHWVRHAAEHGPVIVTDRGGQVAALQPLAALAAGGRLPDREAEIRRQRRTSVDSAVYVAEDRER